MVRVYFIKLGTCQRCKATSGLAEAKQAVSIGIRIAEVFE